MSHSDDKAAVFVEIEADANADQAEASMRGAGFSIQRRVGRTYIGVIHPGAIEALKNASGVKAVERSQRLRHHKGP